MKHIKKMKFKFGLPLLYIFLLVVCYMLTYLFSNDSGFGEGSWALYWWGVNAMNIISFPGLIFVLTFANGIFAYFYPVYTMIIVSLVFYFLLGLLIDLILKRFQHIQKN